MNLTLPQLLLEMLYKLFLEQYQWRKVCLVPKSASWHQLIMMMMNCFCGMVDRRKAFTLISSQDHCQRSSPLWISDTPQAGFEPAQNLSSGLVEWSCAVILISSLTGQSHNNWPGSVQFFFLLKNFVSILSAFSIRVNRRNTNSKC